MKNYFFILLYALVFASCESNESEIDNSESSCYSKQSIEPTPLNSANTFDYVGQIHYDLALSYYSNLVLPTTMDSIISNVNLVASEHPYFDGFLSADYNLVPKSRIADLVSDSEQEFEAIVDNLILSTQTKTDFRVFVSTVLSKVDQDEDYQDIYNYVVAYESSLLDSKDILASEKEYLLTVTSIIRFSVYAKKKRPKKNTDLDWYWLTAKFTGAVEGAKYGKSHAILTALKAGIIQNR